MIIVRNVGMLSSCGPCKDKFADRANDKQATQLNLCEPLSTSSAIEEGKQAASILHLSRECIPSRAPVLIFASTHHKSLAPPTTLNKFTKLIDSKSSVRRIEPYSGLNIVIEGLRGIEASQIQGYRWFESIRIRQRIVIMTNLQHLLS